MIKCMKALLSEFRLHESFWYVILPLVQSALNNMPADRLESCAPITAMTALQASSPVNTLVHPVTGTLITIEWVKVKRLQHIQLVQSSLEAMHKEQVESTERRRENLVFLVEMGF